MKKKEGKAENFESYTTEQLTEGQEAEQK